MTTIPDPDSAEATAAVAEAFRRHCGPRTFRTRPLRLPEPRRHSTTKWGLVGFAKTLAMELGGFGITSNTIHPGAVDGPRIMSIFEGRAAVSGRTVQEEIDGAMANQSVKEFINPDDIAALVLFLAGPHARTISGQMFPIDGDSKAAV
jgi:NAD(P)-dependent dehydrogenase (short-subunit alcohol dehydrogenase family)